MAPTTSVSIVIVNWNSGPLLERCIASLLRHAPECEIVVVDNASDDTSIQFATGAGPAVTLIRNSSNLGFAAGCNVGWRRSRGKKILFLNPDTECFPDSVARLECCLLSHPSVKAVGGHLVAPSGESQAGFNVRPFPTVGRVATEMLLLDEVWPANPWRRTYGRPDRKPESEMEVDQPAAACLMVNRDTLEWLGGFDERFHPAWFEDVDLCKRIRDGGGRLRFQPSARFLHHGGFSLGPLGYEKFLEFFHRNQILYFAKHHGRRAAAEVRALVVAGMYLRSILSFVKPAKNFTRSRSSRMFWNAARLFGRESIE